MTYVAIIIWTMAVAGWDVPLEASATVENLPGAEACEEFALGWRLGLIPGPDRQGVHLMHSDHQCMPTAEYEELLLSEMGDPA